MVGAKVSIVRMKTIRLSGFTCLLLLVTFDVVADGGVNCFNHIN